MSASTYGRQVIVPLTNKSGGAVIAGDVVIMDGSNDESFTTTTSASSLSKVGVVQESIANNAAGRVLTAGYAALVNVNASATRAYFLFTHTVAKQATSSATFAAGAFGRVIKAGTSPSALIYDETAQTAFANPMTTKGDVIVGDTGGAAIRKAVGTDGQVFTADAASTGGTKWATPSAGSAGALIFLERHAASASVSLDFTTFISATYDKYLIVGESLVMATDSVDLRVEVGTGGGPTYDTGNTYEWARLGYTSGAAANNDAASTGIARIFKTIRNTAAYGFGSFSVIATGLQSTALRKTLHGTIQFVGEASPVSIYAYWGMQWTTSGTAATALRFIASSGNITSGSITIYGYTNS